MLEAQFAPIKYILAVFLCFAFFAGNGQAPRKKALDAKAIWKTISPAFVPPEAYKDKYGSYASLLTFYDQQPVLTPQDWKKRREEIREEWHSMMGKWPPFIKNQELKILKSTSKEGFTQHEIKFFWLPGEETTAFLLFPEGEEKKPAVITVYYEPETAIGSGKPDRDFAYQLAKRGFVTLSIGTTQTTNSKT